RVLDLAGRVRRQRADARPGVDIDPHDLPSLELADVGADRADDSIAEVDARHAVRLDVPWLDGAAEREGLGADVHTRLLRALQGDDIAQYREQHARRNARRRPAALHPADHSTGEFRHLDAV